MWRWLRRRLKPEPYPWRNNTPIPHGRRRCTRCKQAMSLHDKWITRDDGHIEHRHCDDPTAYVKEKR